MSNTNDSADKFIGYRYLMDLDDKTQYAVFYHHGKPIEILSFDESGTKKALPADKTIYAMENDYSAVSTNSGLDYEATLYQIKIGKNGQPQEGKSIGVAYEVNVLSLGSNYGTPSGGTYRVDYELKPSSRKSLQDNGFDARLTRSIQGALIDGKSLDKYLAEDESFDPEALKTLPLLTKHPLGTAMIEAKVPQVSAPTPSQSFNSTAQRDKTPKNPKVSDQVLAKFFSDYCTNLTQQAKEGRLDPVIGREEDTDKALINLTQYKKGSVCFTGPAGTGKTAMFHSVAQRIASGENLPEKLQDAIVLEIDFQKITAGTKYRGELEERMQILLDGISEREGTFKNRKVIFAVDELHHQLAEGGGSGSAQMGQTLKKILTARGVSFMGATTSKEYRKYIEPDAALVRRIAPQVIDEPNAADTLTILKGVQHIYEREHNIKTPISEELLRYSINMGARFVPDQFQPDKSVTIIDTACAAAAFRHSDSVEKKDFDRAISKLSKLSEEFLAKDDSERLNGLAERMKKRIKGQDEAIDALCDTLIGGRSGLRNPNEPLAKFVFPGPTGVGKTEVCKILAEELFGSQDALIKIDMSEYMEKFNVTKLIGAPPGYVGYSDGVPAFEAIRQRPYSVVLFDEAEKAHPDVFNILLQALNDGKVKDTQDNLILFNNTIVILTSNLGSEKAQSTLSGNNIGFSVASDSARAANDSGLKGIYNEAVKKHFRPELLGRMDGVIPFNSLTRDVAKEILGLELEKLNQALSAPDRVNLPGANFTFSEKAQEQMLELGFNPQYGARPLQGVVKTKLINPIGKWLAEPGNKETVLMAIKEKGAAKIVIDDVKDGFKVIVEAVAPLPQKDAANENNEQPRAKTGIKPRKADGSAP